MTLLWWTREIQYQEALNYLLPVECALRLMKVTSRKVTFLSDYVSQALHECPEIYYKLEDCVGLDK
jgi:hypothetical protein